jgi:hypothetical protein
VIAFLAFIALAGGSYTWWRWTHRPAQVEAAPGTLLHRATSGTVEVSVFSPKDVLSRGPNELFVEFRSTETGALVDVGEVHVTASMTMSGMAMSGTTAVMPTDRPGRFHMTAAFAMSGVWRLSLDWSGKSGAGAISFDGDVR